MRGSPLKQCLWVLLAAVLLAVPLYRLTGSSEMVSARIEPEKIGDRVSSLMVVRCVSKPEELVVRLGGEVVFDLSKEQEFSTRMEKELELELLLPKGRKMEFVVDAVWSKSAEGDQPMTISVEPDGMDERSATRWSQGRVLNDVFFLSW